MGRFGINAQKSWFIGDAERDIEAGTKAGVKSFKIEVNGSLLKVVEHITGFTFES